MKHIIMFSGGIASWAEAKLVKEAYGPKDMVLLFSDTGNEDADLHRFLNEAAANIGVPLITVRHPKHANIFELARARRTLPNNRMPFCSQEMKHDPAAKWVAQQPKPVVAHFGLYSDEAHRLDRIAKRWAKIAQVDSLLMRSGLMPSDIQKMLDADGLRRPRLYDLGFAHNNCGGGCVRAGKSQWRHLLRVNPKLYTQWENLEREISDMHGRSYTILPKISLQQLRELDEQSARLLDIDDSAGCGCFIDV